MDDFDLKQFYQVFFEESLESLDLIEQILLKIDVNHYESEDINSVFRCMHSLKGGGASFGFADISSFNHTAETYLDLVRNNKKKLTQKAVDILLVSVDLSRMMIEAARSESSYDTHKVHHVHGQIEALIQEDDVAISSQKEIVVVAEEKEQKQEMEAASHHPESNMHIFFEPFVDVFKSGHDPVRLVEVLKKYGVQKVVTHTDKLPVWEHYDPLASYLYWDIDLKSNGSEEKIKSDVFEWVLDECHLTFGGSSSKREALKEEIKKTEHLLEKSIEVKKTVEPVVVERKDVKVEEKNEEKIEERVVSEVAENPESKKANSSNKNSAETSIRVGIEKVDDIINLVGELVITQAILQQALSNAHASSDTQNVKECLFQFEQNVRELQESVMKIRMLPVSTVFNRFSRVVRDVCSKTGKKVELRISGESTEVDKTVLEKLGDPLVHLIRNSLDHGIEKPEVRIARGKPEVGVIHLKACHEGSSILIKIEDDGNGLDRDKILDKAISKGLVDKEASLTDEEIFELIFLPGFSTAEQVTDISGRGVGMDVVIKNVQQVGGRIEIESKKLQGSCFTIRIPLTLSIIDGQIVKAEDQIFIFPLHSVVEIIQIDEKNVSCVAGDSEVYFLRGNYLQIIHLTDVLSLRERKEGIHGLFLVVVEKGNHQCGIVVDDLLAQQQVVIKNIENNYRAIEGIAGATVLGDGTIGLILDVVELIIAGNRKQVKIEN